MLADDPRLVPARPDLAALHLKGRIEADRFAEGTAFSVMRATAPLRKAADATRGYETELLFGETFMVYESREGWAWGQAVRDGYVGYVPMAALGSLAPKPTHRVAALRGFIYPGPSIKVTPLAFLPYGARVTVTCEEERFARLPDGFIFAGHLAPLGEPAADPVTEAERFLGLPYLWGGKSSLGLDCSGLVQNVCHACGIEAPRDSDMQEATLGAEIDIPDDPLGFRRGDLLFWKGHVALAQGEGRMIHATAYSMSVISEPIGPALERIAGQGAPLRRVRRLPKA